MFFDFIQKIKENRWPVYGVEMFFRGAPAEKYHFAPETAYPIYSATKAFTSTAAGLASDEGKFSVDAPIYEYLKSEIPSDLPEAQRSMLQNTSVRRFLTMSVPGYPFRPEGSDWMRFTLFQPIPSRTEPIFSYSNLPAYLVGAAIEHAVGEHLISYLTPRLFEPLGIDTGKLEYLNCPSGHFYGASGMKLTVHELSLLGQFYLQNGTFDGTRLLSSAWIKEAATPWQDCREGGYGYFLWKYGTGFRISGKWGQCCYIFPEKQLMITYLGNLQENSEEVRIAMEQEILREFDIP